MFRIDPFVLEKEDIGVLPHLDSPVSRFQLPALEEVESSFNRLLEGLSVRPAIVDHDESRSPTSSKGKEKQVVSYEDADEIAPEGLDHVSFWLEAGENAPGPSKGRLFQVSHSSPRLRLELGMRLILSR